MGQWLALWNLWQACLGLPNFLGAWNPQGQYADNIICNLINTSPNSHTTEMGEYTKI